MEKIKIMLVLVSMFTVTATFAQRTDFTGNWQINLQKSEFGNVPTYTMNKLVKVTQAGTAITLETTTINDAGSDSTSVHKFNLNGVFLAIKANKRIKLSCSADGKTLNEDIVYLSAESGKARLETITDWILSDDKKTLTLTMNAQQFNGKTYSVKAVYDRI